MGGRYKYKEELKRAKLVITLGGNYAGTCLHRNNCADNDGGPSMNSRFRGIYGKDILREFTAGTITTDQSTGTLLDRVAKNQLMLLYWKILNLYFIMKTHIFKL